MENQTIACLEASDIDRLHGEMRRAFMMISGKWKLEILWMLNQRIHRFGELKKGVPGITQHMLTAQLRELEKDGLVSRQIFAEVPPRVEYALTDKARGLGPVMDALIAWWSSYKEPGEEPFGARQSS